MIANMTSWARTRHIPDQDGSQKNMTCLDCMTGIGLGEASGLTEITS